MAEGRFIAIEGTDGSGISTQAGLLRDWMIQQELEVLLTKEPTTGPIGMVIRQALTRRISFDSEEVMALLFAADRLDHDFDEIGRHIEDSVHVITDRYYLSSLAYQSESQPIDWIWELNIHARRPDLVLYLEVPPRIVEKRMARKRWALELYEDTENLTKVRERFESGIEILCREGVEVVRVDGARSIQEVHSSIVEKVRPLVLNGSAQMSIFDLQGTDATAQ